MGESGIVEMFRVTLIVMAFFSMSMTLITYALAPTTALKYVSEYTDPIEDYNIDDISNKMESGLSQQKNIPIVEVGALVFYSGNFLIDLLLNFLYAIPEMFGMLINGILVLFNIDKMVFVALQYFAMTIMTVMYLMGIIQLVTGIRSGRVI